MNLIIYLLCVITFIFFIISINMLINKKDKCQISNNIESIENFAIQNNENMLLNLPLTEFYISSSHNSYLSGFQILSSSNTTNLLNALKDGARCIELDIHNSQSYGTSLNVTESIISNIAKSNLPIVSHKSADTNVQPLSDYLTVIKNNAFKFTNDPMFLYLEIYNMDKEDYVQEIGSSINRILGPLLYEGRMNYNNSKGDTIRSMTQSEYFINAPIKKLLGKICIIINYYNMNIGNGLTHRDKYLFPVVHGTTDEPIPTSKQFGDSGTGWLNNYPTSNILFGKSNQDKIMEKRKIKNLVGRIYPINIIKSTNYDPMPFFNANYTFISMNYGNKDKFFNNYKNIFNRLNIIPKNYLISTDNKLIKPYIYYEGDYVGFKNDSTIFPLLKCGTMYSNFSWVNGNYTLTMQGDGNLVIYQNYPNSKPRKALWSSKTSNNEGATLWCQYNGNLVIYNKNYKAIWSTNTYKSTDANSYGYLSNNGIFSLYNTDGNMRKAIYPTFQLPTTAFQLPFQSHFPTLF